MYRGDFLQDPAKFPAELEMGFWKLKSLAERPSPRVIKSHLPFHLLPPKLLDTSKVRLEVRCDSIIPSCKLMKSFVSTGNLCSAQSQRCYSFQLSPFQVV